MNTKHENLEMDEMDDHLFTIDADPLNVAVYAQARAEALAEDPSAIMALTRRQVADLVEEWIGQCAELGHDRPQPWSLPGQWIVIDPRGVADLGGGLELSPGPVVLPAESLRACERHVLAQHYVALFAHFGGDLERVGNAMLGRSGEARRVQLRMSALGVGPRSLRRSQAEAHQ